MGNFYLLLKTAFNTCAFYKITGFYCPGCGGTRALVALLKGDILKSLYFHPLVIYLLFLAIYSLVFFIRNFTKNVSSPRRFPASLLYLALGILVTNWILKNAFILFGGIHLI